MRSIAEPVYLIGTSRAALSVARRRRRPLHRPSRPDAVVVTSGMLIHISTAQPSAERNVGRLERVRQPILLRLSREGRLSLHAGRLGSPRPRPSSAAPKPSTSSCCRAARPGAAIPVRRAHTTALRARDVEVVKTVTDWLRKL